MIDTKLFKSEKGISVLKGNLQKRNYDEKSIDSLINLINERNTTLQKLDNLKQEKNSISKKISILYNQKDSSTIHPLKELSREIHSQIELIKKDFEKINKDYQETIARIPNILSKDVPFGTGENNNKIIRQYGDIPLYPFRVQPHYEIAEKQNLIDFSRGVKLSGTRFYVYNEKISRLERNLIQFMLNFHAKKNYQERTVPLLVKGHCMFGTGQLPKFSEDYYSVSSEDLHLIPTAEVPLTNLYYDEIISNENLPIYLMAATPCFRKEAGSAGKDTRGIIRVHQFSKVELVKICKPENSEKELEMLVQDVEEILQQFNLTYRVSLLCSADTSDSSSKTYDIEVYMPGAKEWKEISSCSNFQSYQARRAKIRYKNIISNKNEYIHTLNGSGVAAGRLVSALLEYYQNEDGTIDFDKIYSNITPTL